MKFFPASVSTCRLIFTLMLSLAIYYHVDRLQPQHRVAKSHGYGGDIRVKMLGGWGKKSGKTHSFAKSSIVLGKFDQLI